MKKSLIALAALATVATAAQAQSSVTVYGILDANVQSVKTDGTGRQTIQGENALNVSRLGFRGTEDLGGGLKAEFQLESRLSLANGYAGSNSTGTVDTSQGNMFNREAWVGLNSAQLGAVRFGLTDVSDAVNIDAQVSQFGELVLGSELGTDKARVVRYSTPVFNGISAQVGYASPDSTSAGVENTANSITSAVVKYDAGNLMVAAGSESKKITTSYDQKQAIFGAKYDFGVASLGAWYSIQNAASTSDDTTYGDTKMTRLSAAAPLAFLGNGVKFHVGYLKNKSEVSVRTTDYKEYRLGLTKAFSNRTTGYIAHIDTNYEGTTADKTTTVIGIKHNF